MEGCDDIEADAVLFAIGRSPNVEGLGCEAAGVEVGEKGEIKVDEDNRTNVPRRSTPSATSPTASS